MIKTHTPSKEIKSSWLEQEGIHPKTRPFTNKTIENHDEVLRRLDQDVSYPPQMENPL